MSLRCVKIYPSYTIKPIFQPVCSDSWQVWWMFCGEKMCLAGLQSIILNFMGHFFATLSYIISFIMSHNLGMSFWELGTPRRLVYGAGYTNNNSRRPVVLGEAKEALPPLKSLKHYNWIIHVNIISSRISISTKITCKTSSSSTVVCRLATPPPAPNKGFINGIKHRCGYSERLRKVKWSGHVFEEHLMGTIYNRIWCGLTGVGCCLECSDMFRPCLWWW